MSYTEIDWLTDLTSAPNFNIDQLVNWMREDGRCIVRAKEHDRLVEVVRDQLGIDDLDAWLENQTDLEDNDLDMALIHWEKERRDWIDE